SSENVRTWLRNIEEEMRILGFDELIINRVIVQLLKGEPAEWASELGAKVLYDPKRFRQVLRERYGRIDRSKVELELEECLQDKGESVEDYMHRLQRFQHRDRHCR